jgi:hypothetical protein
MSEPFQAELQACVDAAATAPSLDDRTGVALAGSFYKNFKTGRIDTTFGPGWDELMRVSPEGGYDGLALYHAASRTLVIVNRGTEGFSSLPDWMANVGAVLFRNPGPQMDDALDLLLDAFRKAGGGGSAVDQILICGHSLGGALADAQGALAQALFADNGLICPPVRVVGVASAGFAHAAESLASARGLQISPGAARFITHYVRAEDPVPHHPGRSVFGTDQVVASVYECRSETPPGPHSTGVQWRWLADLLLQHQRTLYFQFVDQSGANHIWHSRNTDTFTPRPGHDPGWSPRLTRPDDW